MDENKQNLENQEKIEGATTSGEAAGPQKDVESDGGAAPGKKAEQDAPKGKKPSVFRGNKFKRGGMATVLTVVFIAVVVVLNLLVSVLSERFPSMNIDLTAQKMNTLSDQAVDIAKCVQQDTDIYLIGTEDAYKNDAIYSSYGLKYSQVMNLSKRLEEVNQKIHVQFIDPDTNPDFISRYASDSLTTGRVLVSTEKRHKVLSVDDMFSMSQNSTTGATEIFSNVDSALAGAIEMVNLDKVPVLTIATGHEEMLGEESMGSFLDMMEKQNFDVQQIDILTEDIPEDTQILMIATPSTDYTEEEIQKLRDLLSDEEREESIAILLSFFPGQGKLPNLTAFLEEWGVSVSSGSVVMESDANRYALSDPRCVIVDSVGTALEKNTYSRLVSPLSVPINILFTGNGDVGVEALWTTSEGAYVVTESTSQEEIEDPDTAQQNVATLSSTIAQFGNEFYFRSVIVFGSSNIFSDGFMATAFDNADYLSDLLKLSTDTDGSAVSVLTERVQTNTMDVTASQNTIMVLGLGVFTIALPVLLLVAGLVIFLKRRHL